MGIDPHPRPPCLVASLSSSRRVSFHFINTRFFSMIANIANHAICISLKLTGDRESPLKAGLSIYSSLSYIGFMVYSLDKDWISIHQVFSSNTYNLMQQYITQYLIAFQKLGGL
jgi:hypothetical protein